MTTMTDLYGADPSAWPDPVNCPVCESGCLHPETQVCPEGCDPDEVMGLLTGPGGVYAWGGRDPRPETPG